LPIPEALIVEADEFMSAMAVACGGAVLLEDPLTYYRLHGGNLYQFRENDPIRIRRKLAVSECLAEQLPTRLRAAGVADSAINLIVEPISVLATRMKLSLDGGKRWQTFQAERRQFRIAYKGSTMRYKVFKYFTLGTTLLLPPQVFYRLRTWYSSSGLRKLRGTLGEPIPNAHIIAIPLQPTGGAQRTSRRHS
jgi:hypothetical protein